MCWRLRRTIGGFQTLHDVSHLDCGQYADTPACGKSPQRSSPRFFGVTAWRSPSFDGDPGEDRHGDLLAISCPAQARYSTSVAIAARNAASSPLPKRDRDHDGAAPLARSAASGSSLDDCALLRLPGVNGMRDKNAGAEKSHQYCC
jgi:hypothetical protein